MATNPSTGTLAAVLDSNTWYSIQSDANDYFLGLGSSESSELPIMLLRLTLSRADGNESILSNTSELLDLALPADEDFSLMEKVTSALGIGIYSDAT